MNSIYPNRRTSNLKVEISIYKLEIEALLEQARASSQPVLLPGGKVVRAATAPQPAPLGVAEALTMHSSIVIPESYSLQKWGKGYCAIGP